MNKSTPYNPIIEVNPYPCAPISLFQPISTNYENNLSYAEYLLGVVKKLNQMILTVNNHTEFINNYAGDIERIEGQIQALKTEQSNYESKLNQRIDEQLIAIEQRLNVIVYQESAYLKAYIDTTADNLREQINNVALGQITVFDPILGARVDLQTAINSLYDVRRTDAITAQEYDDLELTATNYDDRQLTALEYDTNGKALLMA